MFALPIIDQDRFIDLPISSRLLYYELGMRADDDGFIAPQKIIRMLGLSQDDLKILVVKGFLIQFEDGVVVITSWKVNNLIRTERHKPTLYHENLESLKSSPEGTYMLCHPDVTQSADKMATQVRLGKVRLGKVKNIRIKRQAEASPIAKIQKKQTITLTEDQLREPLVSYEMSNTQLEKVCKAELDKIIAYLRDHQGRKFTTTNPKALGNYKKIRLGYGKLDVLNSINNAHEDEYHKNTKFKYLTPEFLFRQDKFEKFLIN